MVRLARRVRASFAGALLAALALPLAARANGAFPDGMSLILRAERPHEIVVATNFGLIISEDDGRTWRYTCEDDAEARNTYRFDGEREPPHRIYAMGQRPGGNYGLVVTADDGCSWAPAVTAPEYLEVRDYFLERAPGGRILALAAYQAEGGLLLNGLFVSHDGGRSFGAPIRGAPPGVSFASVETALGDPRIVYLVVQEGRKQRLERSSDGGRTWQVHELSEAWGEQFFVIAVDPEDGDRLLVRAISYVGGFAVDRLLASRDGGATWKVAIDLSADGGGALGAFLRRDDGSLLVAGQLHRAGAPAVAFVSRDRGESWSAFDVGGVRIRGLGERAGVLHIVANELLDGFALARGPGGGAPWERLLRYADIAGIRPCAQSRCRTSCLTLATMFALFPRSRCDPPATDASPDRPDAGVGAAPPRGCACDVPGRRGDLGAPVAITMLALLARFAVRKGARGTEG